VAVGEHLGYLFTGLWSAPAGVALIQSDLLHPLFGIAGLLLARCSCLAPWSSSDRSSPGAGSRPARCAAGLYRLVLWLLALGVGLLVTA
jgi:hypothetical protein